MAGLEEKLRSNSAAAEYEALPLKRQPAADFRVALRPENASRNWFPNVLPYEDSRVRLIPTASNPHGYINASHVNVSIDPLSLQLIKDSTWKIQSVKI